MDALGFADAEDRHDVGVVQPRRGLGLAGEPGELGGVGQPVAGHHLQRHATAQRFLLGFVDDPHAAPADHPQHPEVAQTLHRLLQPRDLGPRERAGGVARAGLEVLDQAEHREDVADLVGQVGIVGQVLGDRRPLPLTLALQEFLGQGFDRDAARGGVGHDRLPPGSGAFHRRPGILLRISWRRFSARM